MWWMYIIQSQSSNRFYTGHSDDLVRRLAEHNQGQTASTRGRGPWELVSSEGFPTKAEACARERQVKSWKSRRSIEELIGSDR